jgi:hypothetical protein
LANTDIFNPTTGYDEALGFNTNWNYGSPRKTAANYSTTRPRYGKWATRSTGSAGYSFDLTFVDRPLAQVHYIRTFYEKFQTGFFTLIDHDNGDRNHVGRFTSYPQDVETANNKYTITVTFEDMPTAPMTSYPLNFGVESHDLYVVDDWLNPLVATSDMSWLVQPAPTLTGVPAAYEAYRPVAVAGNFAQMEYIGWSFQQNVRLAANLGICDVYIDGQSALLGLDLSNGSFASVGATPYSVGTSVEVSAVVILALLPLGRHRVKFVATGTKNVASTDTGIIFAALQVIH